MGKTQSKRSVDITTETIKVSENEIAEKMEKIDDLDTKEIVNGDTSLSEKSFAEKKDSEDIKNDKNITTENDVVQASGDTAVTQTTVKTLEDDGSLTAAEEIFPLADESIKKTKLEKVKKKWSFRSISFGKKDKQKPFKNEEPLEDSCVATNGVNNDEKTITEPQKPLKEKGSNGHEIQNILENQGNIGTIAQELEGDKKISENNLSDIIVNTTSNTTIETCENVPNDATAASFELFEKTEKFTATTTITNEAKLSANVDTSKKYNGIDENISAINQESQKADVLDASIQASIEKTSTVTADVSASTNGEVVAKIYQNGNHDTQSEQEVVENPKAQFEEFDNAKDMKDVTVAEITQDLSVTCE